MTIKEMRTAAGLTQQALAELIGCSKRAVESWEGGKRQPPAYLLFLLEYYLRGENLLK